MFELQWGLFLCVTKTLVISPLWQSHLVFNPIIYIMYECDCDFIIILIAAY